MRTGDKRVYKGQGDATGLKRNDVVTLVCIRDGRLTLQAKGEEYDVDTLWWNTFCDPIVKLYDTPTNAPDLKKKIAKLAEDTAVKIAELTGEHNLRKAIAEATNIEPRLVFLYSLYGSTGSIEFGNSFKGYSDVQADYEVEELVSLIKAFQPWPVYDCTDGCRSLRHSTAKFGHDSDKMKRTEIGDVYLKVDGLSDYHGCFSWFAEVLGEVFQFKVHVPRKVWDRFISISFQYNEKRSSSKFSDFRVSTPAPGAETISWYGSGDTVKPYSVIWTDPTTDMINVLEGE